MALKDAIHRHVYNISPDLLTAIVENTEMVFNFAFCGHETEHAF